MSDIIELKKTLLRIREDSFSEIPEALICKILDIQSEYAKDRNEASKRIKRAIEDHVDSLKFE